MIENQSTSLVGVLGRIFWLMVGPMLLIVLAFTVIQSGNGWLTVADFGYLGVLAGMIVARWLEFRSGNPQTAQGEPATPGHLKRYLLGVVSIGLPVWVVANVVGNYVLGP